MSDTMTHRSVFKCIWVPINPSFLEWILLEVVAREQGFLKRCPMLANSYKRQRSWAQQEAWHLSGRIYATVPLILLSDGPKNTMTKGWFANCFQLIWWINSPPWIHLGSHHYLYQHHFQIPSWCTCPLHHQMLPICCGIHQWERIKVDNTLSPLWCDEGAVDNS